MENIKNLPETTVEATLLLSVKLKAPPSGILF